MNEVVYQSPTNDDLDIHDDLKGCAVFIHESIDGVRIPYRDVPWVIETLQKIAERAIPISDTERAHVIVEALATIDRAIDTIFSDIGGLVGLAGRATLRANIHAYIHQLFPELKGP